MPTVLCVSHVSPWPANSGNSLRLQKLLLWLRSQGYKTILVLTLPPDEPQQINQIREHVDRLEIASSRHQLLAFQSRRRRIQAFLKYGWPWIQLREQQNERGAAMQGLAHQLCPPYVNKIVRELCQQQPVSYYFAYYAFTIQAFAGLPKSTRLICDTVELFSMPRVNAEGQPIEPILHFKRSEEQAMLEGCDVAIGIQPVESAYLQQLIPERSVITVGLDSSPAAETSPPSQNREVIGIIGSSNEANQEGLAQFLNDCWPRIYQGCPGAELWLAGSLGEAYLRGRKGPLPEGLKLLGWLEDLNGFYRELRLVVNPVLRGTGLKIKTVEALAHSRPVVSYGVGLEGLAATESPGWLEVSDAAGMAGACLTLLQDPQRCDALAEAAKRYALREMNSETVYRPLRQILES